MTVIGHDNLRKLFPNFADDVAENGIDLRIGELYIINKKESERIGCVEDEKYLPTYAKVPLRYNEYRLEPHNFYFARIDRPIHIPKGYIQQYRLALARPVQGSGEPIHLFCLSGGDGGSGKGACGFPEKGVLGSCSGYTGDRNRTDPTERNGVCF